MTLLALDIGNTRLKWMLYERPQPGARVLAAGTEFLEHIDELGSGAWSKLVTPSMILGCNVAGDAIRHRVQEQLELWEVEPTWVVSRAHECGVRNGYQHPGRLGADRWVSMIGARWQVLQRQPPGPVLVVMAGTAVTADALDSEGNFLGGFILPGHGIMLRALESGTAGLRVPTGEVVAFPNNTSDALTSGGTYAITGAIERMHRHISERCGQTPLTLVSGGAAWKVAPHLTIAHERRESLVFDGLLVMAQDRCATRHLATASGG